MHYKHRKPRKSRAGCKMCKPWKMGGNNRGWRPLSPSEEKRELFAKREIEEYRGQ